MKSFGASFLKIAALTLILTGAALSTPVTYTFDQSYGNRFNPADPLDFVEFAESFSVVVPDFLPDGVNRVPIPGAPHCMGGTADASSYGGYCEEAVFDVSANQVSVNVLGCPVGYPFVDLPSCLATPTEWIGLTGGGNFTIIPGQSGTYFDPFIPWFAVGPSVSGGTTLAVNPEPATFGLALAATSIASLMYLRQRKKSPLRADNASAVKGDESCAGAN